MNSMTFVMQSHSLETIGYGYNDHNDQQRPWGMLCHDSDDEDDEPPPRILPQSNGGNLQQSMADPFYAIPSGAIVRWILSHMERICGELQSCIVHIGSHCIWVQSCGVQNWLRHSCQQDLGSSQPRVALVGNMESSMPPNTNDDSAMV